MLFVYRAIANMDDGVHELLSYGLVHHFVFAFQMLGSKEKFVIKCCLKDWFVVPATANYGNIGIN